MEKSSRIFKDLNDFELKKFVLQQLIFFFFHLQYMIK